MALPRSVAPGANPPGPTSNWSCGRTPSPPAMPPPPRGAAPRALSQWLRPTTGSADSRLDMEDECDDPGQQDGDHGQRDRHPAVPDHRTHLPYLVLSLRIRL